MHREKQYKIRRHPKSGWIITRPDTSSTCKVSEALVARTLARLEAGEEIPFRKISYTVAIESGTVAVLAGKIDIDDEARVYRITGQPPTSGKGHNNERIKQDRPDSRVAAVLGGC